MNLKIGVCDACAARFKIPADFRSDRARCRECGGVVRIGGNAPVPRPASARRNSSRAPSGPEPRELPVSPEHEVVPATPRSRAQERNAPLEAQSALNSHPRPEPARQRDASVKPDDSPTHPPDESHGADAKIAHPHASPKKPRTRRRGLVALVIIAVVVALAFSAWRITRPGVVPAHAATPDSTSGTDQH